MFKDIINLLSARRLSEKSTLGSILTASVTIAGLYFGLSPEVAVGVAATIVTVLPEQGNVE